jgi:crotonobetainyl-CoA:carnitine CoA-transferase CaiB-like acyl-CoA transferase
MKGLPLGDVRVADFSWAAAGPYSTLLLASLGAEVIKITSSRARGGFPQQRAADVGRYLNYNKMSITLDLTTPGGAGLAREIIKVCDLVVENYRPGTMKRFGLDYRELVKVKPDIIMVSSSSLGAEGPQSRYTGFAPIFGAMSGLSHMTGYADGIPTDLRLMVDYTVGSTTAYSVLAALYHQRTTGRGQYIDLASRDAMTSLIGEQVLDAQLNGPNPNPRMGNRDHIMAPHGVYRCKPVPGEVGGEGEAWLTIAVATQGEWEGLCEAMGRPEWLADERFSDAYRRWLHQDELDPEIGAWTLNHTPFELMKLLQEKGVAAVPSYSARDLFEDPHLNERRFSQQVTEPSGGSYTVITAPWLLDGRRPEVRRHAPSAGEHNRAIFEGLLGVPPQELERLIEEGVVS